MAKRLAQFVIVSFLLFACSPSTPITSQSQVVTVYSTPAAEPWLAELFACANRQSIVLNVTADNPQIYLRIGEPETLVLPAYKIDEEEILVITHRQSSVQNLTAEETNYLFANGNESVQVWVYASGEDVQMVFDQLVMNGRSVTSSAQIASGPQEMSDVLNAESNAIGILPRHWKVGDVREVFSAGTVPVLAITRSEATGAIQSLLTCLTH